MLSFISTHSCIYCHGTDPCFVCTSLLLLPSIHTQIIHSAVCNAKPPFTHQILLAQSVAHTFPLLYTTACPVNIIGAQPCPRNAGRRPSYA
jgi:hypothetical protein